MRNLLEKAKIEIEEEIKECKFICDSDNTDRFLDELSLSLAKEEILQGNEDLDLYHEMEAEIEELTEELLDEIKDKIMFEYNQFSTVDKNGDYNGFYYKEDVEFESMEEFNNYFGIGE